MQDDENILLRVPNSVLREFQQRAVTAVIILYYYYIDTYPPLPISLSKSIVQYVVESLKVKGMYSTMIYCMYTTGKYRQYVRTVPHTRSTYS